jgi:erythronate-4-phosphate dehydrogenase
MKLVIDENIAFAEEAFSGFGEIILLPGRKINNEILKNADVLIVRSVTEVNEKLLNKTNVRFVGTATIGRDHINTAYLESRNIEFADAAGCNADAVAEYVLASLAEIAAEKKLTFNGLKTGVIGVGNIGSRIVRYAKVLGMNVIKNDPPLKRKTGDSSFKEIDEITKAGIITFHVPLNMDGPDKTYHLFGQNKLSGLNDNIILLNTSRGSVIDNSVLESLITKKNITAVLDVWENEPAINTELLKKTFIGTPHIAGYSFEGKVNGTMMIYSALSRFLGSKEEWKPLLPEIADSTIKVKEVIGTEETLKNIFRQVYDIRKDNENLKRMIGITRDGAAEYFDWLRKSYPLRREFNNYSVFIPRGYHELEEILSVLRFNVETY